jgi:hypothetical protein
MLTLFTTAKPFEGHSGIIQRNALKSWKLLHSDVEVILFGDDPGSAEIARELGFRHEPFVERNSFGTKRLDYIFDRAQELARHDENRGTLLKSFADLGYRCEPCGDNHILAQRSK